MGDQHPLEENGCLTLSIVSLSRYSAASIMCGSKHDTLKTFVIVFNWTCLRTTFRKLGPVDPALPLSSSRIRDHDPAPRDKWMKSKNQSSSTASGSTPTLETSTMKYTTLQIDHVHDSRVAVDSSTASDLAHIIWLTLMPEKNKTGIKYWIVYSTIAIRGILQELCLNIWLSRSSNTSSIAKSISSNAT